jgi:hypothetical protein
MARSSLQDDVEVGGRRVGASGLLEVLSVNFGSKMNLRSGRERARKVQIPAQLCARELVPGAVVVGAWVILFDPIFQGLALSLMAGELASLLISRMAIPVLYSMLARRRAMRATSPAVEVPALTSRPSDRRAREAARSPI